MEKCQENFHGNSQQQWMWFPRERLWAVKFPEGGACHTMLGHTGKCQDPSGGRGNCARSSFLVLNEASRNHLSVALGFARLTLCWCWSQLGFLFMKARWPPTATGWYRQDPNGNRTPPAPGFWHKGWALGPMCMCCSCTQRAQSWDFVFWLWVNLMN